MSFNPTYKVDVLKVFRTEYSGEPKELRERIRPILSYPEFRRLFSDNIVNEIRARTEKGIDKDNKPLGTYRKSYTESAIFQIYKGRKRNVDLVLTGEMLASLRSNKGTSGVITISLDGTENKAKAYGHITGFRGHPFIKGVQKRDFLGLPDERLGELLRLSVMEYIKTNDLPETIEDIIKEEREKITIGIG
jgi:hypothetical protein